MKKLCLLTSIAILAVAAMLVASVPALAHEDRPVGPYNFHVGWHVEPALVGQLNAVELTVTQSGKPVSDVEKSLEVTISTGGKTSDPLSLDPSDETPGLYTASVIPTVVGDYRFHFVGMIGDTKVDETFDSAQGKFASVDPVTDLQFPEKVPSNADLQREIDDLKAQIAAMKGGGTAATAQATANQPALLPPGSGKAGSLEVRGAYAKATAASAATPAATMAMGGMGTSAAYMLIQNNGDSADKLIGASSDAAQSVALHQTQVKSDVAQMLPVDSLEIPARGSVELKPGGYHIMLENLKADLLPGQVITLNLKFASGTTLTVQVPVKLP
jgi:copper(I)-binding protein